MLPLIKSLGYAVNNGFGPKVVPFSEIEAFCRLERLSSSEAMLLRRVSEAYCSGMARGKDSFAFSPMELAHG